ncbi:MAG: hypothetical protein GF317_11720 [Candidatus Lokiarchaeota archaeon]|nr:hypothetical protein [Candidatus Lokiarchaeota archaeon]MBD3200313.1 hypothetical protein [Candidatus Lokiarchaeota archaeon]
MAFQDLTQLQILEGTLGLIWILAAVFIGLRVITKATSERKELITVGLSYIFVSSAWWGVGLQFISYGFFDIIIGDILYLLVANIFIPVGLVCWVNSFAEMINPEIKNKLFIIFIPFCLIWEILIFVFAFTNLDLLGSLEGLFNSSHGDVIRYFIIIAILSFVVSGVYFSIRSMSLEDREIKWKGRFLLIAWISFAFGAILDSMIQEVSAPLLIFIRLILITGAIEYYLGFFLPNKLKGILIKNRESYN